MEESSLTTAPSILDGDNYETWAIRMTVHLEALDVWEAVEENYEVPPLGANPTMAKMKLHKERKTIKKFGSISRRNTKEMKESRTFRAKEQLLSKAKQVETHFDVLFVPDIDQNYSMLDSLLRNDLEFILKIGIALSRMLKTKRRLGHFHHDTVLYMKKNQIAEGLPDLEKDLPICATCQYGKQTKLPFPKKTSWRATQKLQLVHIDVGGPQKTPSLKGRNNVVLVNKFKAEMKQVLEMTDLREMTYFLE
ncbi:hypothetical protein CK203_048699 [Vitis vinifera]|uniref:DUF4219 domain-containing protein n=1 Tax=Vitis vinifera TaxID=29760 RepID=A0A438GWN0_VITVI|nr:hypothetical protein CK203_048699 [Vitis vinifera]